METRKIGWRKAHHHKELYLFILPTLVLISLFLYYPASSGIYHSLFRWNGSDISEYIGLENFTDLLSQAEFWQSFKVVLTIGFWNVIKMIPAILVAVCIHRCRRDGMQWFYRVLFVIPMVIPSLVIVLIWRSFFFEATTGYLNKFLYATGLFDVLVWFDQACHWGGIFTADQAPAWLGQPSLILPAAIIWGFPWVGSFAVLTYLAKLQGIDKHIYEAAECDGASWWTKFARIEMPLISGSLYIMLVFTIIGTISDAGMVIALAGIEGGPGGKLTVPAVFMIRKAFVDQRMGYACAVGIVLTLIVLFLQKLTSGLNNWDSFSKRKKWIVRCITMGLGGYLFVSDIQPFFGFVMFLAGFPWPVLAQWITDLKANLVQWMTRDVSFAEVAMRRDEKIWRSYIHTFPKLVRKIKDILLRAAKHGFIWLVLASAFLPVYLMVIVSLKTNQQFYENPTVAAAPYQWENWKTAWEEVSPSVANSIYISTMSCVLSIIVAVAASYFFTRYKLPLSGLFWNAILVLMMMPAIANLIPLFLLLKDMHLLNTFAALILVTAAMGQIQAIFVLRSFLQDIPQSLFDAADIDGGSHWCQMRNIVLPLSGPIIGTLVVMHFIYVWNEFVLALIVMRSRYDLPVTVQLLRMAGEYIKLWGPMMAGYAIASIPVIILFVFSMKLFVRGLTAGAVKE